MQGPNGRYRLNWVRIGCYTNTCMSKKHSKHLQMSIFCHIDLFKPSGQTYAKAMLGSVGVYFMSLRSYAETVWRVLSWFRACVDGLLCRTASTKPTKASSKLARGSVRLKVGVLGDWMTSQPLKTRQTRVENTLDLAQNGGLDNTKLWLTVKQQQRESIAALWCCIWSAS